MATGSGSAAAQGSASGESGERTGGSGGASHESSYNPDVSYGSPASSDVDRTPIATASHLGVLARLAAAAGFPQNSPRALSLAELAGASADSGDPDPGRLAGLMEALVGLSVAEEGDRPKTYRLANPPPASTAAGGSGTSSAQHPGGPPDSSMVPGLMFGASPPGSAMQPVAWTAGYGQAAMYPMYNMYPAGTSPPQYYPQMPGPRPVAMMQGPAGHLAQGMAETHNIPVQMAYGVHAAPGFTFNATPHGSAPGKSASPQSWGPMQFPLNMSGGSGQEANSGGSQVAPPPPPPRSMSGSSVASQTSKQSQSDTPKISSSSGKSPCTFFLKTGTCAYGDKCKFGHPPGRLPPQLNSMGYPLRPGEFDCIYFMKRGVCGFGVTCKFNHPEPHAPGWQGATGMQPVIPGGPMMIPYTGMMQAPVMPLVAFTQPQGMPQPGPMSPAVSMLPASPRSAGGSWRAPPPPPPPASAGSPSVSTMSQLGMTASSPTAQLHEILGIVPSNSSASVATAGLDGASEADGNSAHTDNSTDQAAIAAQLPPDSKPIDNSLPSETSGSTSPQEASTGGIFAADDVTSAASESFSAISPPPNPQPFAVTAT